MVLEGSQVVNLLHSGIDVSSNNIPGVQNLTYSLNPNYLIAGNSTVIEASRPLLESSPTKTASNIATPIVLIGGIVLAILLLK